MLLISYVLMDLLPCQDKTFSVGYALIFDDDHSSMRQRHRCIETDMLLTGLTARYSAIHLTFAWMKKLLAFIKKYLVVINLKLDY